MLTGVISESMFEKNEMRKEEARAEHEDMRRNLGTHAADLWAKLEVNHEGETRVENLKKLIPGMVNLMEAAGGSVTSTDMEKVIENMDTDGGGLVSEHEFVDIGEDGGGP
jgi:hypothetical protein